MDGWHVHGEELPAWVGVGNLMVANWVVGCDCCPMDLGAKFCTAPWDLIVVVLTPAVAETHPLYLFMLKLSDLQERTQEEQWDQWGWRREGNTEFIEPEGDLTKRVLEEKTVRRLGVRREGNLFVVLHKAKVTDAIFEERHLRSRGPDNGIRFGSLTLGLATQRQRLENVSVGIVDVRRHVTRTDADALVAFTVLHRVDMLTGFFGTSTLHQFVSDLATRAKAVSWTPMFQSIRSRGESWAHPSFFLFFGCYRNIQVPETPDELPDTVPLGEDIVGELVSLDRMPQWERNDAGSPFVHNIGNIKMRRADWERWFKGCFQTCMWLGTALPGRGSQNKRAKRMRDGGGKAKGGKGFTKGKGKGKDKGKDKGRK